MFVYTVGDIVNFIIFALLALVLLAVVVFDKKDDDGSNKVEKITLKSMVERLFAEKVENQLIIGWDADGGYKKQGCCPRCGIILTDGCKRCPKCWQKLRWSNE